MTNFAQKLNVAVPGHRSKGNCLPNRDTAERFSIKFFLIAVVAAIFLANPAEALERRVALVIGNGSYATLPELSLSLNDATDMGKALQSLGFEVMVREDLDKPVFERALEEFEAKIIDADVALFYFSGHGVQATVREGASADVDNFLVPVGGHIRTVEDIPRAAVSLSRIHEVLERASPRAFNFVILDACSDSGLQARDGTRPQGLARPRPKANTLVALAAGINQLASPGYNRNSLYTQELLEYLGESGARLQDILGRTRASVEHISLGAQNPIEFTTLKEPFYPTPPLPAAGVEQLANGTMFRDDCVTCPLLVVIPPGTFDMGSTASPREQPVHQVTIDLPFAIGRYEVTLDQYDACVADGGCRAVPTGHDGDRERLPVGNIRWDDTQDYVRWLNGETGHTYRLPSEAEWEYAARAGTDTAYPWGESAVKMANCKDCSSRWSGSSAAPVGSFPANAFDLHDMNGNVWEWVSDCAHGNYEDAPEDGTAWITDVCRKSVLRGGSFRDPARVATSSFRAEASPAQQREDFGFRVVRALRQ